jgi:nitrate reductase (cytochrome), electron transfer subunit
VSDRRRWTVIAVALAGMVALVFGLGERLTRTGPVPHVQALDREAAEGLVLLRAQRGQYTGLGEAARAVPDTVAAGPDRPLASRYTRRAYAGAPPVIPHAVLDVASGATCLGCHLDGGWAEPFSAWTPKTPHPELRACHQCHVPQATEAMFRRIDWPAAPPPPRGRAALPEGPPSIPHRLQMREHCAACHAGPAVPAEIRTSHPERAGCLQCHVLQDTPGVWTRSATSGSGAAIEEEHP